MKAVLFDMDGVIVDSEVHWVERERETILPAAVASDDVEPAEVTGLSYREIYDHLAADYEMLVTREELEAMFEETAMEIYGGDVDCMPGLHGLLADVGERGLKRAVVSSSPHDWIDRVVDRFDLRDSFDAFVSADDVDAPGKPEPHVYEYAAATLEVDPADCLVVEDSPRGTEAAGRAGATVVGYRSHAGEGDAADLPYADYVVEGPEELRALVEELLAETAD